MWGGADMMLFNSILKTELSEFYAIREASMSKDTLAHDRNTLLIFDRYLCINNINSKEISEETIYGWLRSLNVCQRTLVNKAILIRLFIGYLNTMGIKAFIPEIPKSSNEYIPYLFSDEEITHIFQFADNIRTIGNRATCPYMHLEIPMILRLLFGCGLRIGEVLSIKINDVDLVGGILTIRCAKGNKQRLIPMHNSLTTILGQYIMAIGIQGMLHAPLFPGVTLETPIPKYVVKDKFKFILNKIGITLSEKSKRERGPCLHCLRHTFVLKSFSKTEEDGRSINDSIPYLSIYLGHESLNETEKYLKFSSDLFPQHLKKFHDYSSVVFSRVSSEVKNYEK